jgi:hypothetical protein
MEVIAFVPLRFDASSPPKWGCLRAGLFCKVAPLLSHGAITEICVLFESMLTRVINKRVCAAWVRSEQWRFFYRLWPPAAAGGFFMAAVKICRVCDLMVASCGAGEK